jgi:2-C-methyl-D-erythritol 2,4-cyclodiphosphate synthase
MKLADLLGVAPDCVNVKAKTGEKVGHIGRGEAIGCHAVVLIEGRTAEAHRHREEKEAT